MLARGFSHDHGATHGLCRIAVPSKGQAFRLCGLCVGFYSPSDLFLWQCFLFMYHFCTVNNICFFSLKFSLAVKPIQCCSMKVAPCMIDLNVTPRHKPHSSFNIYDYKGENPRFIVFNLIVRESLHDFSFAILSDTCDNLGLE